MSETTDDNECQKQSKSAKSQEVTSTPPSVSSSPKKPAEVPTDDNHNTIEVTYSDKLDNKLSNKPDGLAEIINMWPKLPEHIKAAIRALVQTNIT